MLDVFNVWFAYVASHANIADLPSRGALGEMTATLRSVDSSFSLEGSAVRMELPDISDGWLEHAATRARRDGPRLRARVARRAELARRQTPSRLRRDLQRSSSAGPGSS